MKSPLRSMLQYQPQKPWLWLFGCLGLVVLIAWVDIFTLSELTLDILYLIPIAIAAWFIGAPAGIFCALTATMAWSVTRGLSGLPVAHPLFYWWDVLMLGCMFGVTASLLSRLHAANVKLSGEKEELRKANQRLTELDRRKDEFISICSHDIRGPLSGVLAAAQTLLKEFHGPVTDAQRVVLNRNINNLRTIIKMTNELLDLARLDEGQEGLELARFNLRDVIAESIDLMSKRELDKPVKFEVLPLEGEFEVEADRLKILRVCNNLISNAIKYSPPDGVIRIKLERRPAQIALAVADAGPGIAPENLTHLFDRYTALARHKTSREEGTGLGLSISQELVKLHGGIIEAFSEMGRGSVFVVTLPRAAAH